MKKINALFIFTILILLNNFSFGQDNKDYDVKKTNFYRQYLQYKEQLKTNPFAVKPIDPSGIFSIDANNNFADGQSAIKPESVMNSENRSAPWAEGQGDIVSTYTWAQTTTTYTPVVGTVLGTAGNDDNTFPAIPLGFTFTYDGVTYTTVDVNANGYLKFGTISGSNYPYILSLQTNIFAAMNNDLRANNTTSTLQYLTTGVAGSRIFTLQWSNYGNYNLGWDGGDFSFQVKLYETTNVIQVVFGPFTTVVNSLNALMQSGINSTVADYNCRTTTTDWSATTAGGSNTAAMTFTNTIKPANGLTFSWSPPAPSPMVYTSSTTTQVQNGANVLQSSINNAIIQVQVVMSGTLTPIDMTSMAFNTTGTTNAIADLLNAKVYYTGTSNVFATTTQFGTTAVGPNGSFSVNGTQTMQPGTNYFWLTYDIQGAGPIGDFIDAQCTGVTGSGTMSTQTPTVTNPAGNRQIDNYCRGTYTNNGCLGTNIYITNVTLNSLNNTSACDPGANFPINYSWYGNLSTNVEQGSTYPMSATTAGSTNAQGFATWIDWNNNGIFTDAGEYYNFPLIASNAPTTTTFNLTIPPSAPLGSHRMRVRNNFSTIPTATDPCTNLNYGETEDYSINVTAATNMTYSSSTATQTVVSTVYTPSTNAQMIGIQVVMTGTLSPVNVTSFTLNTNGSTAPGTDISKARLWYTGTSSTFATNTQFGNTFLSPSGSFVIPGNLQLAQGTNYFWLTYEVPSNATNGNTLDAECNSITVASIANIPTVQAPAGSRLIGANQMSGTYSIPGNYANFTAAVNDLNTRGVSGPVTFTVAPGFIDTVANLVITTSGTITNPIVFKNGSPEPRAVNPIIVAGTGISTTTDGIIKLSGADYITIDGIDLQENPANVTTTTQMEWGYALVKPSGTDGCQNVTIKNCAITLNKTNANSVGIYSHNHLPTSTTTFIVSATAGANSNNSFQLNNITNCYTGIYINGYADVSPFTFYDQNNSASGNNITNYGGAATTAYGIYNIYQNGLNLSNNTINSTGGVNSTATLYGIFCSTMNNSSLTISGNTVTIAGGGTTSSIYGINFGNGSSGTSNTINILNNTVQNSTYATATSGIMYHIYCNATSYDLNVSGNKVISNAYGTVGVSTGQAYYIYNLNGALNSISFINNLDSNNVVNGTTSYGVFGISNQVSTNYATITGNRIRNNVLTGTTAAATSYGIINSAGTFTCTYNNNIISDNSVPSTVLHTFYCLYNSATAPATDYSSNTVSGNTSSGTGVLYSLANLSSPVIGGTVNITNNTISNQQKLTATGTGSIYGIYQSGVGAATYNINNNSVTGLTSAAATLIGGIYQTGTPPNYININNNIVGNLSNAGISTIYGIYNTGTSTSIITESQDSVFNLTSPGSTIYGMYNSSGMSVTLFRNKVSGITSNTSTTAVVYGIYSAIAIASNVNYYNNNISDINAPASTSTVPAVSGIYIASGIATTTYNLFYNTIYLNATSSSVTTFGTAGIYALSTPVVDMRNNVIVNKSVAGPTGGNTAAYRRSSTVLTTYSNNSNNNCFYSGTPSAANLIYFDGTNSDQTLAAYKTRVIPRDNVAVTENVPFVNGATAPYDLRIQTGTPTALESGGKVVSTPVNITNDIYNTARYPNGGYPVGGFPPIAPDIGAHEFGGLNADNVPPSINYTALGNGGTTNRAFNNVTITDASGVNITVGTKPRCYYKRSTDGNVINDNTSGTDGWKYVEANGTTSPFDFTINYALLNGGTGVVAGNIVNYFVVAQDLAGTPNVAQNQAIFATAPTSVALIGANAPITTTLSYNIGTNVFSGTVNVGTAQTYTSLTGAGGLFASINAGTVAGNITAVITSDMTEDGSNALNTFNETGPGGYRLTIVPNNTTPKVISGSVAQGMIRLNGTRRVTIDGGSFLATDGTGKVNLGGDNPAPGKYLTFRNTNGLNPTFVFINEATADTIKYCNIESNNTSSGTTQAGTILFSTTTGLFGNDSNVIDNCDIRDRSDLAGTPLYGVYNNGSTTTVQQYNSYNKISNCNIYNYFVDLAGTQAAVYLNSGTTDWTITGNSVYQTTPRTITTTPIVAGIYNNISTNNNNNVITNNFVGGSAPLCGSTPMTYTGTGAYSFYGIQAFVNVLGPTNITGNTIRNISVTCNSATGNSNFFKAIYAQTGWINVNNNTIGSSTGNGNITMTINTTATAVTMGIIHHLGFGTCNNNTMGSVTYAGTSTALNSLYAGIMWANTTAGQTYTVNNNLIGSLTDTASILMSNNSDLHQFRAIYFTNSTGTTNNITNNVISNITSTSTSSVNGSFIYAINNNGGLGNYNFTGNTIRNLTIYNNALTTGFLMLGINSTGAGINNYTQNTISGLYSNGNGGGSNLIGGILAGGTTGGTVSRNKMYDFRFSGSGALAPGPLLLGINCQSTGQYTISNNILSITNGDLSTQAPHQVNPSELYKSDPEYVELNSPRPELVATLPEVASQYQPEIPAVTPAELVYDKNTSNGDNIGRINEKNNRSEQKVSEQKDEISTVTCSIAGVFHTNTSPGACNYWYNSFYVGGNQPGGMNSYTFARTSIGSVNFRNNLFVNARSGGGNHYAVSNQAANPLQGWSPAASNYNTFIGSTLANLCEWGAGNPQNFSQWLISSGGDKQSWGTNTAAINPTLLFNNIATGDLSILSGNSVAWILSGKGLALTGQNVDYTGDARVTAVSGGCTDIGADEFAATPPSNPVATQTGAPAAGNTSTYTLWGRTICTIDWGLGGTYPSSVNVNYFSGITPLAPNVTNPQRTSQSYWTAAPVGTFSGTTYDITWYYGENETFSITSPSTNVLLGKNDNTFWMTYPQGAGNLQSDVNSALYTVKARGMLRFSSFTLSDAALPAEFPRTPLNNSTVVGTSTTLIWSKSPIATTYRAQLATDSIFTTIVMNDSTLTDTTKLVSGLINNQNYWWRVNGKNGTGTGGWSQVYKFTVTTVLPPALVNLKVIPGGFYNLGSGQLNMKDTLRVILVDSATCNRVDSNKVVVDSVTFNAALSFANVPTGSYYIFVFHRNHIPVASRLKQTITRGSSVNYDFTNDSTKTYGLNTIKLAAGIWGMIPGDANQDQFTDGLDQTIWILTNGLDGYLPADFNGDLFVDGLDQTIWILYNGNSSFLPCNITALNPTSLEEFMKHHGTKLVDNQRAYEQIQENAAKKRNNNPNNTIKEINGNNDKKVIPESKTPDSKTPDSKSSNTNKQNK